MLSCGATPFCSQSAGRNTLSIHIYAWASQKAFQQDAGHRCKCPECPSSQFIAKWSSYVTGTICATVDGEDFPHIQPFVVWRLLPWSERRFCLVLHFSIFVQGFCEREILLSVVYCCGEGKNLAELIGMSEFSKVFCKIDSMLSPSLKVTHPCSGSCSKRGVAGAGGVAASGCPLPWICHCLPPACCGRNYIDPLP